MVGATTPSVGSRVAAEATSVTTMQWWLAQALARIPVPPLVWLRPAKIAPPRAMDARSRSISLAQSRREEHSAGSLAVPLMVIAATAAAVDARLCTGESLSRKTGARILFCSLGAVQELQIRLPGHGSPLFF